MNSGMYAALSGNIAAMQRLDVLSNNLANINTAGFKKDRLLFDSLLQNVKNPTAAGEALTDGPVLAGIRFDTDFAAGPARQTGNVFDMALDGDGFFVVNTPQGPAYTRQGNFHLDAKNQLVTVDGYEVLAGGAPLVVSGGRVEIDAKGAVSVDGGEIGTLDMVDFAKPYALQKQGNTMFVPTDPKDPKQTAGSAVVRQGFLEDSNVNAVLEMARLIETTRYFEACQKAVRSYDDIAAKAANDLGKI